MMSFVSIINSAKGALETLQNPDASGWEKFSSVLMSFGSVMMMSITMMDGLKKAFDLTTVKLKGLTLAKMKDTA
jgi:hypothetical protein